MPKVLRAASQTIRNLLKPAVLNNLSEDRLRNDRQSYVAMTRALVDAHSSGVMRSSAHASGKRLPTVAWIAAG